MSWSSFITGWVLIRKEFTIVFTNLVWTFILFLRRFSWFFKNVSAINCAFSWSDTAVLLWRGGIGVTLRFNDLEILNKVVWLASHSSNFFSHLMFLNVFKLVFISFFYVNTNIVISQITATKLISKPYKEFGGRIEKYSVCTVMSFGNRFCLGF